jgi:hypothetical protein
MSLPLASAASSIVVIRNGVPAIAVTRWDSIKRAHAAASQVSSRIVG